MTISGVCLIHCLALPFLVALVPLAGMLFQGEHVHEVHIAVLVLAAPVAWFAFAVPLLRGQISWPLPVLAILALGLLGAGLVAPEEHEITLTIGGGSALGAAHLMNLRSRRHEH
jgi:hypothetical protein